RGRRDRPGRPRLRRPARLRGRKRARAARHGHGDGLHGDGDDRLFPRRSTGGAAGGRRRGAGRLRRRRRGRGHGSAWARVVPRRLVRRARGSRPGHARRPRQGRVRLHAIVEDLETAKVAIAGGATVVQLRRKGASTDELVETGRPFRELPATFIVNDDVEAAIRLDADGVHLGRDDAGAERALEAGLALGLSAASVDEAQAAERAGGAYIAVGPVCTTPPSSKAVSWSRRTPLSRTCTSVSPGRPTGSWATRPRRST